jgi:Golgi apparatus protein 1
LCLQRKQRSKLTSGCEYELFRKEAQDAGDIRLSVRLFRACLPDKKQFCADVPPGQALASHCLEEHRESLSDACRCVSLGFQVKVPHMEPLLLSSMLNSPCLGSW